VTVKVDFSKRPDDAVITTEKNWVGRSVPRFEDARRLTGQGRYVPNLQMKGMLHAAVLRSPHAHARIRRIDTSRAKAMPGVVEVLTGREAAEFSDPVPPQLDGPFAKFTRAHAMAIDKVVYHGEPVAAVAAEDPYLAEDALEAIEVEYEELPPVLTIDEAQAPGAPLLYESWGDNLNLHWNNAIGDVDGALAGSAVVIEEELRHDRCTGTPMETRGVLASYDPLSKELTAYMSTQFAHTARSMLAQSIRIPEHKIRIIAPDVGGGFGNKLCVDAETVPCLLTMRTGRPVKWIETRSEQLLTCSHARDYRWQLKAGFTADGKITALDGRLAVDVGCDGSERASGVGQCLVASHYLPGAYHIPAFRIDTRGVVTNKAPSGAYRGFGKDIACYAIERLMNLAARQFDISPEEIRRRNFIQPEEFPYAQITGPVYDSGDYPRLLEMTEELIDVPAFRERQKRARAEGRYLGFGFSSMLEPSGAAVPGLVNGGYESGVVRVNPDGSVSLQTGLQDIGQGVETTLAQVVADQLTVTPNDVKVIYGDTDGVPYGMGPWSSRGASYGVSAAASAAGKVREKILRIAAHLLEANVKDLQLKDGTVYLAGDPGKKLTFGEIARTVYQFPGPYTSIPDGEEPILEARTFWMSPVVRWVPDKNHTLSMYTTHPSACFGAIVEVDPETGRITLERMVITHDCGTVINPIIVDGQVAGGAAQGIGAALGEELRYDAKGHLLNVGFREYLVPTAGDLPTFEIQHLESPSPFTPLGTKGTGESGAIGTLPAVVNAVEDALGPFGVTLRDVPLSPERVLRLIKESGVAPVTRRRQ
jgi:carbon-monoxide dehydrogenase large subunit